MYIIIYNSSHLLRKSSHFKNDMPRRDISKYIFAEHKWLNYLPSNASLRDFSVLDSSTSKIAAPTRR